MIAQMNCLKVLKRIGITICYNTPPNMQFRVPNQLGSANAGRHCKRGQLPYNEELSFGNKIKGSQCQFITSSSHGTKRPVRSSPAAKIIATGEAIDDEVKLTATLPLVHRTHIPLMAVFDSKGFFRRNRRSEIVLTASFVLKSMIIATTLNGTSLLR